MKLKTKYIISENLLKSALRIRKDYLKIKNEINNYDDLATNFVSSLDTKTSDLKDLYEKINNGSIKNTDHAKEEMMKIILGLETSSLEIESEIDSLNDSIEVLQKEEGNLYLKIKERYNDLSDDQILDEVSSYIKANI